MSVTMFISGSMGGGKSKQLIDIIKDLESRGSKYIVFKPTIDTRDGLMVKSRDYKEGIDALPWYNDYNMKIVLDTICKAMSTYNSDSSVFFDEVHFMTVEDIKTAIEICKKYNLNLYMSGLETDFKFNNFPSTKFLKENCDSYIFLSGRCKYCKQDNAVYNLLFDKNGNLVTEGETIQPGDSQYDVACKNCFGKVIKNAAI